MTENDEKERFLAMQKMHIRIVVAKKMIQDLNKAKTIERVREVMDWLRAFEDEK